MTSLFLLVDPPSVAEPEQDPSLSASIALGYAFLWHPHFLATASSLPKIVDLAHLPTDEERILLVPASLHDQAKEETKQKLTSAGTRLGVIPSQEGRAALAALQRQFDLAGEPPLGGEFYAAGYAYLGVQILLRRLGYSHKLDEGRIWAEVHQAAEAYVRGEEEHARDAVHAALDILHGNRQAAHPATIHWVDIALARNGDEGRSLLSRMALNDRFNLLVDGASIAGLNESNVGELKSALANATVELLAGRMTERPFTLLPFESRRWEIERSLAECDRVFGREIEAYSGRIGSLSADLPQILMKYGYRHVFHSAFDGSKFPRLRGPKIHWTSADGSVVEALTRVPINAGREDEALRLFVELNESCGKDRSATMVLAHWIDAPALWYEWLLTVQQHAAVFGKFETFSEYFLNASLPTGPTVTRVEEYLSPRSESVEKAPESQPWRDHFTRRGRLDRARSLAALARIAGSESVDDGALVEDSLEQGATGVETTLDAYEQKCQQSLVEALIGSDRTAPGYLIVNPCSFPRRVGLELAVPLSSLGTSPAVRAVEGKSNSSLVILDLPGFGCTWIPLGGGATAEASEKREPVVQGNRLRNTMIEVEIDRKSGGIRGLWSLRGRYSRLGQQLARGEKSRMVAKSVEVTQATTLVGEITTRGVLLAADGRREEARYVQRVRVWRGRPVIHVDVTVEPLFSIKEGMGSEPITCRWAWPDDKTVLLVSSGPSMQSHYGADLEATDFIEFREQNLTTNILTGGLPFHHRSTSRTLDTLLLSSPSGAPSFQFQIALDVPNPFRLAQAEAWPVLVERIEKGPAAGLPFDSLLELTSDSVHALSAAPMPENAAGIRLRLAETLGAATRAQMRLARPAADVRLANFRGESMYDLHEESNGYPIDLSALEWQQVEVIFEPGTGPGPIQRPQS